MINPGIWRDVAFMFLTKQISDPLGGGDYDPSVEDGDKNANYRLLTD